MDEITKFPTTENQEALPVIGMIAKSENAPEPEAPVLDADDPASQREIMELIKYNELQRRAQHLLDYVHEKKITRVELLAALLDR
jgi:hypothetical protein